LGRLLPDLGLEAPSPLPAPDERLRAAFACARTLLACARRRPLLLVVEDAHAADALTVDALHLLAHDLRVARAGQARDERAFEAPPPPEDAPLLVLATLSRDELAGRLVEPAIDELAASDGVREIALAPLEPD